MGKNLSPHASLSLRMAHPVPSQVPRDKGPLSVPHPAPNGSRHKSPIVRLQHPDGVGVPQLVEVKGPASRLGGGWAWREA